MRLFLALTLQGVIPRKHLKGASMQILSKVVNSFENRNWLNLSIRDILFSPPAPLGPAALLGPTAPPVTLSPLYPVSPLALLPLLVLML